MKQFNARLLWLFGLIPTGAVAQSGGTPGIDGADCINANGGVQTYFIANPTGDYDGYEVTRVS